MSGGTVWGRVNSHLPQATPKHNHRGNIEWEQNGKRLLSKSTCFITNKCVRHTLVRAWVLCARFGEPLRVRLDEIAFFVVKQVDVSNFLRWDLIFSRFAKWESTDHAEKFGFQDKGDGMLQITSRFPRENKNKQSAP